MEGLVDEIRINSKYTQLTEALYSKTLKDGSSPKIRKQLTNTTDYLKKMSNMFAKSNELVPPNCRYIEKLSRGYLIVVEEPPALRTIKTTLNVHHEVELLNKLGKLKEWGIDSKQYVDIRPTVLNFHLAFPYVIFIKVFDEFNNLTTGQIFLRVARLSGLGDYLLKAPLTNISEDQYICYGGKHVNNRSMDIALSDAIMLFWASTFNSDYMYNYRSYRDNPHLNTFIGWQYHSQINPMFIYSTEWIRMSYNLGGAIDKIKTDWNLVSSTNIGYTELSKIFVRSVDSGKQITIGKSKARSLPLFYDIAQGMFLEDDFFIHIGDSIKLKNGKRAFVDSFIGVSGSVDINYIQFKTEDETNFLVKMTREKSRYLIDAFKKERYSKKGVLANGVKIKEGDIVILKSQVDSGNLYKHVKYIRKTRDGITEAKLGNDFYILENTTGKIFNIDKPEYKGIILNKSDEFIILTGISKLGYNKGYPAKFNGISVNRSGILVFEFQPKNKFKSPFQIRYDPTGKQIPSSSYQICPLNEVRDLPPVFSFGRNIISINNTNEGYAWATKYGLVVNPNIETSKPKIDKIVQFCLFDDNTRFKMESSELNVEFSIGDKVVVADWLNPINSLIVKTIEGFKVDRALGTIDFVLTDRNGNITSTTYVHAGGDTSNIFVGRIRKIVNKFGNLTSGTKIVAKEGFIPNFPKKDTNIIVGFLIDTGCEEPLVLCSNGCTLWYSYVISSFKKITMKSKKWATLNHAPLDVQKIKFQPGDIIMCKDGYRTKCGWAVWSKGHGMYKMTNMTVMHIYSDYYHLDPYMIAQSYLDCIPSPRVAKKVIDEAGCVSGIPNFHGLIIEIPNIIYKYINDERSVLYVSDPHK